MIIDAHQHFWLLKDRVGEWPPETLEPIYRDFEPDDLLPLLNQAGVQGTVLIQTLESLADTTYMLELARNNAFILGVVGWVDMKSSSAPTELERLSQHKKFKGIRPMLQSMSDDNWIDDEALLPAVKSLIEHGLVFDALVLPRHLKSLYAFASRYPDLPIVIDHGAKPLISTGEYISWRNDLAQLASLPNVSCKLSGLLTERGEQLPQSIRPYAETIYSLFGTDRVIWGSDWPVLRLAGDYHDWLDYCREIIPYDAHLRVFGENALQFYGLSPTSASNI